MIQAGQDKHQEANVPTAIVFHIDLQTVFHIYPKTLLSQFELVPVLLPPPVNFFHDLLSCTLNVENSCKWEGVRGGGLLSQIGKPAKRPDSFSITLLAYY